jgi:tetratricopeptide (TPR) repeat protein
MVETAPSSLHTLTAFDAELAKARRDIDALQAIASRNALDLEKRARLAYRQFHLASLTGMESNFKLTNQTIVDAIRDFGPKEDICLLKANLDSRFHRPQEVKQDLQMCPALAKRFAGRSILADVDFQEGRYEEAQAAWEGLIQERRTWDNLARLAHFKGKMGDVEEADRLYVEAENELTAKEMRAFAWMELQRGVLAMSRGKFEIARAHYDRASSSYSGHWHIDEHIAELLAAEEQFDEAIALLESVVSRAPKPELKQAFGDLLSFLGRTDEAQPWFNAALADYLQSVREGGVHYYHHLADFYADAGRQPAEAVKWARKDIALRCNFSTQSALAWALFQNGEIEEGVEYIKRALSSGAQDGGIFGTAAALFAGQGDSAASQRMANAAAQINPHGHSFHMHH